MTDADKLRVLANWFDMFDEIRPRLVDALPIGKATPLPVQARDWVGDDEVQRDLRRIADLLELCWTWSELERRFLGRLPQPPS